MEFLPLLVHVIAFTFVAEVTSLPNPKSLSDDVDKEWMTQTLTSRFAKARHHVTGLEYKEEARDFIADTFRGLGLETHLHNFSTLQPNVTGVNVIGVLKGRYFNTSEDRVAGIGAHYDTMRNTPGVNDNGGAMVIMLEAARRLTQRKTRNHTLIFFAFDFEEWEYASEPLAACKPPRSLCGSTDLVQDWIPAFWGAPTSSMTWGGIFVMDTVINFDLDTSAQNLPAGLNQIFPEEVADVESDGSRGDFVMMAGRPEDESMLDVLNSTWQQAGPTRFELEVFKLPKAPIDWRSQYLSDFSRSDHASFWNGDLSAVFLTDTANFRGYMTKCYHQACDNVTMITPARMDFAVKTTKALVNALDLMAPAEAEEPTTTEGPTESTTEGSTDGQDQVRPSLALFLLVITFAVITKFEL